MVIVEGKGAMPLREGLNPCPVAILPAFTRLNLYLLLTELN